MIVRKVALFVALLLFPALVHAQTEVVVWHAYRGGEKEAFEKVVAAYNASQKKVRVAPLAVPYDAFADKITAAVPRGKGPDVFIYAQDRLGGWVTAGNTIEPLDFFIDPKLASRFIPSTLQAMTFRKTVYGLPLNYKVMTLVYNKALVKTPPKTTGELVKIAKANTDAAAGRFGLVYWYSNWYYHAPLFNGFGGGVFDAAGKPVVNSAANVKSVELLMKWVTKDKIVPAEPSTALITSLFNEGKAAIVFSGPWFLEEISPTVRYGLALLPTIDEAGGNPMKPWMTVEGVYIAAPSKHKDEAFEFARYLTDLAASRTLALEGSQSPANKDVYNDPAVANSTVLKAFRTQVDFAVPMPNVAEMTMMWSPVTTAMNAIVQQASSPKAALDKAQKDVVDAITKLKR